LKVAAVLPTVLGSTSRVLTKVINTQSAKINIAKDIMTFHIKKFSST